MEECGGRVGTLVMQANPFYVQVAQIYRMTSKNLILSQKKSPGNDFVMIRWESTDRFRGKEWDNYK